MTQLLEQIIHPVDQIVDFVKPYFPGEDPEAIKKLVHTHWLYGTIDAIYRNDEIVACVRWNISSGGIICDVLDLYIKEGENGFRLMKHLIARNWHRFPSVKVIRFKRGQKYPNRGSRIYSIHYLLHLKESPYGRK